MGVNGLWWWPILILLLFTELHCSETVETVLQTNEDRSGDGGAGLHWIHASNFWNPTQHQRSVPIVFISCGWQAGVTLLRTQKYFEMLWTSWFANTWLEIQFNFHVRPPNPTWGYQTCDSASSSKFHHLASHVVLVSHSSNFHHWPLLALLVALVLH